eukprot:421339-Pyramimonas_sp.AAC.1
MNWCSCAYASTKRQVVGALDLSKTYGMSFPPCLHFTTIVVVKLNPGSFRPAKPIVDQSDEGK